MAESKDQIEIKEYAGGAITERKATDAPSFLKFAFPVIAICCTIYLIVFMNGEIHHATRGKLVQQFNAATHSSSVFMYVVAALIVAYLLILMKFVLGKADHD